MAEHVTLSQQSTYLREQFNRFDNTLMNMFESLDVALSELEHPERYSHAQMFDIVWSRVSYCSSSSKDTF